MVTRLSQYEAARFKDTYSERFPAILTQIPVTATPDEAFSALQQACRTDGKGAPETIKLFIEGMKANDIHHPALPRIDETNMAEYQTRLLNEMSGAEFAIVCPSIQKHSLALFERARRVLTHLFGSTWLPAGFIDLELFLGRYTFTTGGIHQERRSNLHCVVDGHKDMLLWQPDTWRPADVPNLNEYQASQRVEADRDRGLPEADLCEILNGGPGEFFDWPPDYWHVGRSPEFSISVNIAIYCQDQAHPFQLIQQALSDALWQESRDLGAVTELSYLGGEVASMPQVLQRQLESLIRITESDWLAVSLALQWAKRVTGLAFVSVPPRAEQTRLPDAQELSRIHTSSLLWLRVGDNLVYAANGYAGTMQFKGHFVELLTLVDSGNRFTIEQFITRSDDAEVAAEIRNLVLDLQTMRAIHPVASTE